MAIGKRVRELRKSLSLTQQELADKINVNRAYLGEIEIGRKDVSLNFLQSLIAAYSVNLNWLLTGEGNTYREEPPMDRKLKAMQELFEGLTEQQRGEILSVVAEKKRINELIEEVGDLKKRVG